MNFEMVERVKKANKVNEAVDLTLQLCSQISSAKVQLTLLITTTSIVNKTHHKPPSSQTTCCSVDGKTAKKTRLSKTFYAHIKVLNVCWKIMTTIEFSHVCLGSAKYSQFSVSINQWLEHEAFAKFKVLISFGRGSFKMGPTARIFKKVVEFVRRSENSRSPPSLAN